MTKLNELKHPDAADLALFSSTKVAERIRALIHGLVRRGRRALARNHVRLTPNNPANEGIDPSGHACLSLRAECRPDLSPLRVLKIS